MKRYLLLFTLFCGMIFCGCKKSEYKSDKQYRVEFHLAEPVYSPTYNDKPPVGYSKLTDSEGRTLFVKDNPEMITGMLDSTRAYRNEFGDTRIAIDFNAEDAKKFAEITSKNVGRQLAIIINCKLYCAPYIREPITGGKVEISGKFTLKEAEELAGAMYKKPERFLSCM